MHYKKATGRYKLKELQEINPVGLDYLVRNERLKEDFTNRIADKKPEKERLPWGLFGYTYIGHNKMWINESLDYVPEFKEEVEIHEAIHTTDEYETRMISRDMIKREPREDIVERLRSHEHYLSHPEENLQKNEERRKKDNERKERYISNISDHLYKEGSHESGRYAA